MDGIGHNCVSPSSGRPKKTAVKESTKESIHSLSDRGKRQYHQHGEFKKNFWKRTEREANAFYLNGKQEILAQIYMLGNRGDNSRSAFETGEPRPHPLPTESQAKWHIQIQQNKSNPKKRGPLFFIIITLLQSQI